MEYIIGKINFIKIVQAATKNNQAAKKLNHICFFIIEKTN